MLQEPLLRVLQVLKASTPNINSSPKAETAINCSAQRWPELH